MSTYKRTGPGGVDFAVPAGRPLPPPQPIPPCPPPDFPGYPYYPPFPGQEAEPVPTPPIPGRPGPGPIPPCPVPPEPPVPPAPPKPYPYPYPVPPAPPCPPYPPPKPERVDECSKKLAKLSQKSKVLVQMIKDFEQRNKAAILTIGPNSYQFGTENIIDFDGEPAKGMYAELICGDPIEELLTTDYVVDDTKTRVALKDPKDLLQSELARVRQEITLVAAKLNEEVTETANPTPGGNTVPGTDEET